MEDLPDALFVVDTVNENIAVPEAHRLGIPVVAMVDTNCDPDEWTTPSRATTTPSGRSACSRPAVADDVLEGLNLADERLRQPRRCGGRRGGRRADAADPAVADPAAATAAVDDGAGDDATAMIDDLVDGDEGCHP